MNFSHNSPPELNVRSHKVLGLFSDKLNPSKNVPVLNNCIVILIHGFNTDQNEAESNYKTLKRNLHRNNVPTHITKDICHFYWPGNWGVSKAVGNWISKISYPLQIINAKHSADMLGAYISELVTIYPSKQFIIIAHSLGCRLTMELAKKLLEEKKINTNNFRLITLMAAAIQENMVTSSQNARFSFVVHAQLSIAGIYSNGDKVLKSAFPIGQFFESRSLRQVAIGYSGKPTAFWSKTALETNIDHNEYWKHPPIGEFLSIILGYAAPRQLVVRAMPNRIFFEDRNTTVSRRIGK